MMISEVAAWHQQRNYTEAKVDWQFKTVDDRIKLKKTISCNVGVIDH